jgi:hypothetical protein
MTPDTRSRLGLFLALLVIAGMMLALGEIRRRELVDVSPLPFLVLPK